MINNQSTNLRCKLEFQIYIYRKIWNFIISVNYDVLVCMKCVSGVPRQLKLCFKNMIIVKLLNQRFKLHLIAYFAIEFIFRGSIHHLYHFMI